LKTMVGAGFAGAIWSETSRVTRRFNIKGGPSLRCWILGHDDWVRREPGRLYLECLDCGPETPGWTTSRNPSDDATTVVSTQAIRRPDRSGSDVIPAAVRRLESERPANHPDRMPIAA
jgi:hypothetical protein